VCPAGQVRPPQSGAAVDAGAAGVGRGRPAGEGVAEVTEDEAFIRAVVDSPGDDLPRLVYADWLDDRSDPRGPYLRAELEWAKPWRSGERPTDSPELREMAAEFDPVWVARVSRPPMGACCEHVRFEHRRPATTPESL